MSVMNKRRRKELILALGILAVIALLMIVLGFLSG